ncbi:hypothetical protein IQ07DRAFT_220665 [Pyrenochaeta sp. DS3sAY3a]|nr:hypothetical protein IQ07DRAFT_220665 [Pyrenochaeta sp. DS3sAY3a]
MRQLAVFLVTRSTSVHGVHALMPRRLLGALNAPLRSETREASKPPPSGTLCRSAVRTTAIKSLVASYITSKWPDFSPRFLVASLHALGTSGSGARNLHLNSFPSSSLILTFAVLVHSSLPLILYLSFLKSREKP